MDVSLYVWFAWQTENFSNLFLFSSWLKDCKYAISSWSRSKSRKCQLSSSFIERHMMLQAKTARQKHLPTRMKVAKCLFKHSINLFHEINIVNTSRNENPPSKLQFCNKALCGNATLHCQQTFGTPSLLQFIAQSTFWDTWLARPRLHFRFLKNPRVKGVQGVVVLQSIFLF